jgi:hypothetical protein
MSLFTKTPEVDPLDAALTSGRSVRDQLGSYVRGLEAANSALDSVIADEQAKINEAQSRVEIARQDREVNAQLASNLRQIGFVGDI